jgi:hypothetical protein
MTACPKGAILAQADSANKEKYMIQRAAHAAAPLLLAFVACGCSKAPVVVTVNVNRVVKESQRARRLIEEVESYADATGAEFNDAAEKLRAAASDPSRLLKNSRGPRARGLGARCAARRGRQGVRPFDEPEQSRWPPTPRALWVAAPRPRLLCCRS